MSIILLTGRNGFIGQELVHLLKKNHKVISVIRTKKANLDYKKEELVITDICKIQLNDVKKFKIDLIIHLAALIRGATKEKLHNNVESTKRISFITSSLEIPIIFSSTTNIFFNDFLGSYAESKILCEKILKKNNRKSLIIRVPLVVGKNSSSLNYIKNFYMKYSFLPLFGKQEGKTQPIHVSSLKECIMDLVRESKYDGREINLIGEKTNNYRQITTKFIDLGHKIFFIYIPLPFIFILAKFFELINIPFLISCEELMSLNKDKVLDKNKILNLKIVSNNEEILFKKS